MFLEAAHISTPSRDVKALLSRYQYEDSQHADRLKERLVELRVSKRRAYEEPNQELKVVFDEALDSRGTAELLAGLTRVIKPARTRAYRRYAAQTNGLADYGGVRTLKEIIDDEERAWLCCEQRTPMRAPHRGRLKKPRCGPHGSNIC